MRRQLSETDVADFIQHLRQTYAKLISPGKLIIKVNGKALKGESFDNWAYPPECSPTRVVVEYPTKEETAINLKVTAGVLSKAGYETGEWGVYFYCNSRLIQKAVRTPDVGFTRGEIGVPHHSHSASRVIVEINGPASLMPWTSNKSAILFSHETYRLIKKHVVALGITYAKISKSYVKTWADDIFGYSKGQVNEYTVAPDEELKKQSLPAVPPPKPTYAKELQTLNCVRLGENPGLKLFLEGVQMVDEAQHKPSASRNIFAVVLADAILRFAIHDYADAIRGGVGKSNDPIALLSSFPLPIKTQKTLVELINLRCAIDQDALRPEVPHEKLLEFRAAVQSALLKLFGLKFPQKQ